MRLIKNVNAYPLIIMILMVAIPMFISGCATSYMEFIETLNEREVQSCIEYNGSVNYGTGIGGSSGSLHGITVTGGAPLELCKELLR